MTSYSEYIYMLCELEQKLHRSLRLYSENYHGADNGAEKSQKHTQDMPRRMQSDAFQQTTHTNVCNPAVRLKSLTMTLCCCCNKLAAELFASVMMEKKKSHSPPPPRSLHGVITSSQHFPRHMTSTPSDFHFSGS